MVKITHPSTDMNADSQMLGVVAESSLFHSLDSVVSMPFGFPACSAGWINCSCCFFVGTLHVTCVVMFRVCLSQI